MPATTRSGRQSGRSEREERADVHALLSIHFYRRKLPMYRHELTTQHFTFDSVDNREGVSPSKRAPKHIQRAPAPHGNFPATSDQRQEASFVWYQSISRSYLSLLIHKLSQPSKAFDTFSSYSRSALPSSTLERWSFDLELYIHNETITTCTSTRINANPASRILLSTHFILSYLLYLFLFYYNQ